MNNQKRLKPTEKPKTKTQIEKDRKKRRQYVRWGIAIFLIVIGVGTWIAWTTTRSEKKEVSAQPTVVPYSSEEMLKFWDDQVHPIINIIIAKKCFDSDINEHYREMEKKLKTDYDGGINFELLRAYAVERGVFASTRLEGRKAIIGIFLPNIMDHYHKLKNENNPQWEELFETDMVISFLHEMEHITYGYAPPGHPSLEQIVDAEKRTWAITCEKVIRPFFEKSHISSSFIITYNNWVRCGRDVEGRSWEEYIRGKYSPGFKKHERLNSERKGSGEE